MMALISRTADPSSSATNRAGGAGARHAAEALSRSQVIEVPEAGHGSIIFSQCVKDIGMAFTERPE